MPFFQKLSAIFTRSPRRQDDRQRSSPSRRNPSASPTRPTSHSFSRRSSRSDTESRSRAATRQAIPSGLSEASHSYADISLPPPEPRLSSGRQRHLTSPVALEHPARLGTSAQMWRRDQPRNDAQDEARLMGAKSYKDPGATAIKPGASFQKNRKPGASGAFRPADTLSKHSKASGPVRAQGKERQPNSRRPYLDNAWDYDGSDRPNKRRRHGQSTPTINLTDDVTEPVSSIMEMLPPASQLSPRIPSGRQKHKSHERQQLPEYRDLEDIVKVNRVDRSPHSQGNRRFSSVSSLDEGQFTENAAQHRRSMAANAHVQSDRSQRQTVFQSVEIRNPTNLGSPTSPPRQQLIKSEGMRRISDFNRESSDELQGGATTHPVPKSLDSSPNLTRRKTESKTQLESPMRERSPTDIKTTNFAASPRQGPKKMKNKKKKLDLWLLEINSIRFGPIKKATTMGERMTIRMDVDKEKIELGEDIVEPGKTVSIPLRQIRKVLQGREISCKVRIELSQAANSPGDKVDVEFTNSADKLRLCSTLQNFPVNMQDKDGSFMDKIFATYDRNMELHGSHTKMPSLEDVVPAEPEMPSAKPSTRTKVSSALQDVNGETSRGNPDHDKEGGGQKSLKSKFGHSSDEQTRPQSSKADGDAGVEIPVKRFQAAQPSGRETRASARLTPKTSAASEEYNANTRRSPSTDDEARKKWQNPLVYPKAGKKKAEVCVEDRDRLREGEFLNDNLIGFYIRFLQDHLERTNKAAAETIYFFNSYFYATITNTPRGVREINYSGVEKWTRSVDLFSYDYIIVPINENAHWYVAIICNLPSLSLPGGTIESDHTGADAKETSTRPASEVQTILETPEPEPAPDLSKSAAGAAPEMEAESSKEQEACQSLASMTLGGANAATEENQEDGGPTDEWPEEEENVKSPPAKFGPVRDTTENAETPVESATASQPSRKSKKTRTGPKLDPRQPTIITFDSLDLARSPTVTVLRDYICKEAASKKGVKLDAAKIKGMRARQVPLQPNYSDCGLYLLAYIEKFVQDPNPFITKILRREMDAEADWPPLGSGLLRHRLRKFLDDLYEEQTRDKVDGQAIMANQKPVSFLLGPPLPSQPEKDVAESTQTLDTPVAAEPSVKDDGANEDAPDVESSAPDQVELVPTGPSDGVAPRQESTGEPSREKPGDFERDNDKDVIEVPDSQETVRTKLSHKKKKLARQEKEKEIGDPSIRKRKKGTDKEGVRAEVHIRGTPPPTEESGRVRRSPRGMSRRDCS